MQIDWNQISILEYSLMGSLLLVFFYQLYFYIRYIAGVLYVRKQPTEDVPAEQLPGVSVIVCARNEEANIEAYLQSLLTQKYPQYEVIVVNDGSEDNSREVVETYMRQDRRLRMTFVPKGARVRSTKKLGLTLAAKAATYDYLLLTDADCRPESSHWIESMMRGFVSPDTEVVLGYGAYFPAAGWLNRIIRFDTLFNGLHFLGAAVSRVPYMGVGRNLAYRKDTFFRSGGFSRMMNVRSGDDDLFVNHVANKQNTQPVICRDSITWSLPKTTWKEWIQQKRRHLSVSPKYRVMTKLRLGIEPLTRGLFYGLVLAVAIVCGPVGWIAAASTFVLRLILQRALINAGARKLGQKRVGRELLVCDILLPLLTLYLMLTQPFHRNARW